MGMYAHTTHAYIRSHAQILRAYWICARVCQYMQACTRVPTGTSQAVLCAITYHTHMYGHVCTHARYTQLICTYIPIHARLYAYARMHTRNKYPYAARRVFFEPVFAPLPTLRASRAVFEIYGAEIFQNLSPRIPACNASRSSSFGSLIFLKGPTFQFYSLAFDTAIIIIW